MPHSPAELRVLVDRYMKGEIPAATVAKELCDATFAGLPQFPAPTQQPTDPSLDEGAKRLAILMDALDSIPPPRSPNEHERFQALFLAIDDHIAPGLPTVEYLPPDEPGAV